MAVYGLNKDEGERVLGRWVSASGVVGPVIDLSPGGRGSGPEVGMSPSGRAFVAWRLSDPFPEMTLLGRWVERDGSLGPLLTLVTPEPGKLNPVELNVAVDPAGTATVLWRNDAGGKGDIRLRRISPDSSLGPVSGEIGGGGEVKIADLPNGTTVVVWRSAGTAYNTVSASGEIGTVQTISSNTKTAEPTIGAGPNGSGLVIWREGLAPPFTMRGVLFDATGAPVGGEFILDNQSELFGTRGAVAADSTGNLLAAWVGYTPDSGTAYVRGIDPAGEFTGPRQPISTDGSHPEDLMAAAIDDRGGGAVTWQERIGEESSLLGRQIGSSGIPDGSIATIAPPRVENGVEGSSVPALGFAAFLSRQGDEVFVRRFLEPPICRDSAATVTQGRPILVAPTCTGPGVETTRVLSVPGHGTVAPVEPGGLPLRYTPKPGFEGVDSFIYAAGNDGGFSNPALVTVRVGKDTVRPRVTAFKFVRGKKRSRFVLRFSEDAKAKIVVGRRGHGGAKSSRARALVGTVKSKGFSRRAVVRIRGKLAKRLARGGGFRATAVATDRAGNRSKPRRLKFRYLTTTPSRGR